MKIKYAAFLALKKLNVQKARTLITVLTVAVLFGVVATFMISSRVFLSDISKMNEDFFNGKTYISVREISDEDLNNAKNMGAKILNIETLRLDRESVYDPINLNTNFNDLVKTFSPDSAEVLPDEVLEKMKISEPKNNDAMPVFVSYDVAAEKVGIDLGSSVENLKKVRELAKNKIIEYENEGDILKFEIIGLTSPYQDLWNMGNFNFFTVVGGNSMSLTRLGSPVYFRESDKSKIYGFVSESEIARRERVLEEQQYLTEDSEFAGGLSWFEIEEVNQKMLAFDNFNNAYDFTKEYGCLTATEMCQRLSDSEFMTFQFDLVKFRTNFEVSTRNILIFFSVIAAFILALTLSKIFLDEQKTSAIFQAVGANRRDIFKIYFMYSMFLGIIIAIFVQIIGYFGAFLINLWQSDISTQTAKFTMAIIDDSFRLNLFGFGANALLVSLAALIVAIISYLLTLDKINSKNIVNTLKD
ncbi:hypothetical protein KBE46_02320 [Candidatus Saccharibacteria bacterium]|nr:hypothetical protein [Candidatus Saccharibacteria bacterium]MBP9489704.1 hypothetical protein [Candidatus Saccharibacteria bacterium]MBP9552339.1 hypothetical protein [Candidatus Saccharibacteria bacterium]